MSLYDAIVGHENITLQLREAVRLDKVSHAYILNGEDGSGKNMIAKAFAESLLCENRTDCGCGECHFCKQTASGNNPDLKYIQHEKPASIGVDDVREQLVEDVQIKPYNGLKKVYIIDEAEKMTAQAQNAILKTIEEPPEYSVVIFLTNNVDSFLPTIVSRCITYNLKPLRENIIMEYLIKEYKIPDYEARICASFSQGYIGRAIRLIKSEDFGRIKEDVIRTVTNIHSYEIQDLIDVIKNVSEYKININDFIDMMEMWYRDVLLFKVTKDPNNLIFADEINYIRKQASKSSYEGIESILESCEIAKARLKANVNFDLAIELMLLRIKEN